MKILRLFPPFLIILPFGCSASMDSAYGQGQAFGGAMIRQPGQVMSTAEVVPQFNPNPPEQNLSVHDFEDAKRSVCSRSEVAQFVKDSSQREKKFLGIHKEQWILDSGRYSDNPLAFIQGYYPDCVEVEEAPGSQKSSHIQKCEESGQPVQHTCHIDRIVTINQSRTAKHRSVVHFYSHGWGGGLSRNAITGQKYDSANTVSGGGYAASSSLENPLPPSLHSEIEKIELVSVRRATRGIGKPAPYVSMTPSGIVNIRTSNGGWIWINGMADVDITYRIPLNPANIQESIQSTCDPLEEKTDQGICDYEQEVITQGSQTRSISDFPIYKDWWQKVRTYQCYSPSLDNCDPLRAQGCSQIGSNCKTYVGPTCTVFEQTFECSSNTLQAVAAKRLRCGSQPFCLSGECMDTRYSPNQELAHVLAKMAIFKELQNELKDGLNQVFKGEGRSCKRDIASFRDCCKTSKGWGVSLGLAGCDGEEVLLGQKRQKGQCHFVGTFCAQKVLGVCVTKKSTFCCFGSKLLRILQEQARAQLGMGWGSAESPDCRGLTPQQLASVDFSKLDLREVYAELMGKLKSPQAQTISASVKERVEQIQQSLKNPKSTERGL